MSENTIDLSPAVKQKMNLDPNIIALRPVVARDDGFLTYPAVRFDKSSQIKAALLELSVHDFVVDDSHITLDGIDSEASVCQDWHLSVAGFKYFIAAWGLEPALYGEWSGW